MPNQEATYNYDLLCIGSGPAGQRAAVQAAKLGKRVAIIERRRSVGGVCAETGTIPSKTFREAVRATCESIRRDSGTGFAPRKRPNMKELLSRVSGVVDRETSVLLDQLQRNDVNVILGTARFVGPHSVEVAAEEGTRTITAERILVAVGTLPVAPAACEPDGKTLVLSDSLLCLDTLPRTVSVVGAGVIGIEYASMFAALGIEVTLIDKRTRPLEFLDHEVVDLLIHLMRSAGVSFRLGESVADISILGGDQPKGEVVLESGKRVVADLILYAVGRQGATASLNLEAAGLEADSRGRLQVNGQFRTKAPHIYAAGDVIGFPSLAATSSEQGRLAALDMFEKEPDELQSQFPIGIYAIPEISMVGATEKELTDAKIPYECGIAWFREISRGQICGDTDGMLKMLFHCETRDLLGVHVIGHGATEIVHTGQAVMSLGGGLPYFLKTVFNYPTYAEAYKVAALDAHNKLQAAL